MAESGSRRRTADLLTLVRIQPPALNNERKYMRQKSVENIFEALYRLTDMRNIFRETSPAHELNESQEKQLRDILGEVRKNLDEIEGEMLK